MQNNGLSIIERYKDVSWPNVSEDKRCEIFDAETLVEALNHYGLTRCNEVFCTVVGPHEEQDITFGELLSRSQHYASALLLSGVKPGDRIAIMLGTQAEFLFTYFGTMLAGMVPAPVAPPFLPRQMDNFVLNRSDMLKGICASTLVTSERHKKTGALIMEKTPSIRYTLTVEDLDAHTGGHHAFSVNPAPGDEAMIQFSSGSGGSQKAISLTHGNIMSNVRSVYLAIGTKQDDVFVIWLPMYHDMGLLGCLCQALFIGCRIVLIPPSLFITFPLTWLSQMHKKGGTISVAPNFGYQICVDKIREQDKKNIVLSRWRIAMNGAEMVTEKTINLFSEKYASNGFRPSVFMPVYGLAEATLAVCFIPPGTGAIADRINRSCLETEKTAMPTSENKNSVSFISVGKPIPGVKVRIADEQGNEVNDRIQGRLLTRSSSVMKGYAFNPTTTSGLLPEGWLDTGDLAYRVGDFIFLTGRSKDIIIKAGRNYYPQHFEEALETVPGIRKDAVAAFNVKNPQKATEDIVVMAETSVDKDQEMDLIQLCRKAISSRLEITPDDIVILPSFTLPKTSSGKIQRPLCRNLYLEIRNPITGGEKL